MGNLIQSLSQTPLPTILVVAGILFLFLSIGGHLGAKVTTDSIKRKFAGMLGVVLMIGGISLYFAGELNDQKSQESPLSEVVRDNAYELRANSIPSGRVIEESSQ